MFLHGLTMQQGQAQPPASSHRPPLARRRRRGHRPTALCPDDACNSRGRPNADRRRRVQRQRPLIGSPVPCAAPSSCRQRRQHAARGRAVGALYQERQARQVVAPGRSRSQVEALHNHGALGGGAARDVGKGQQAGQGAPSRWPGEGAVRGGAVPGARSCVAARPGAFTARGSTLQRPLCPRRTPGPPPARGSRRPAPPRPSLRGTAPCARPRCRTAPRC